MEAYKEFLAIWDCIHIMNAHGIFSYGIARNGDGGPLVEFENDGQRKRYQTIFKH